MTTTLAIGGHGEQADPVGEARAREATLAQFFLGDPQGWKGPEFAHPGGAAGLRAEAEEAGIALYVRMMSLTKGAFGGTGAGMAFGIGGMAGVAGMLVGAAVNGPAGKQMTDIGAQLAAEGRPPTAEEAGSMAWLQARMRGASLVALVLLLAATACIAVARYV